MHCHEIRNQLAACAEGQLSPGVRERVQVHLHECASCWAALARLDKVAAAFMYAERPPVPAGLTAKVMAAARNRQPEIATDDWSPLKWWQMAAAPMRVAAAGAVLAGLILGVFMEETLHVDTAPQAGLEFRADTQLVSTYALISLGDTPGDLLADGYLELVSLPDAGGR